MDLTDEELAIVIQKGRVDKEIELKRKAYFEKVLSNPVWYTPTAKDLKNILLSSVSKTGRPYEIIDKDHEKTINEICMYFGMHENSKLDSKKGLMLVGQPGCGKTHIMNLFCKNPKASYSIPTCKVITERFASGWTSDDRSTIEVYSALKKAEVGHQWDQTHLGYCFGDLGAETSESVNFGNRKNVMEEIVFNRYESNIDFTMTHFTTNLNAEEIEKKYGQRMRDRLKEMVNMITMPNHSFR